ncbi:hypothetical protein BKA70DRAFT_1177018 [Coprinopsis sp. MPI-PUGE-AT-0042]|nr:hypothetical protein BKA70DRAFT_1177018 [Coprinopsis sp. MPI-PUGE-AT-0042]
MQLKATGAILSTSILFLSIFSTIVVAKPALERVGSAIRSYHSASQQFLTENVPSMDDLWEAILAQSANAQAYANSVLKETGSTYRDVASKVDEFKSSMSGLIADSKEFKAQLETSNISFEDLSKELSQALEGVSQAVLDEFKEPLPEDQDERYTYREKMIEFALDKIQAAFEEVCAALGMEKVKAYAMFKRIRPKLHHILSVTGNIIDRHPILLDTLIFAGTFLLIPEAWLLRPLFRVFGFGPAGPIGGSVAAWLQRRFWGGFVARGGWFAILQRAGMVGVGWGVKSIGGIVSGIIGGVAAAAARW